MLFVFQDRPLPDFLSCEKCLKKGRLRPINVHWLMKLTWYSYAVPVAIDILHNTQTTTIIIPITVRKYIDFQFSLLFHVLDFYVKR